MISTISGERRIEAVPFAPAHVVGVEELAVGETRQPNVHRLDFSAQIERSHPPATERSLHLYE